MLRRKIESSWGISIDIIGQQPSGDITTSDDNSARSATFVIVVSMMYKNEVKCRWSIKEPIYDRKGMYKFSDYQYDSQTTGDDFLTKIGRQVSEKETVDNMIMTAKTIGWSLKECNAYPSVEDGGVPISLGHSVEPVTIIINNELEHITIGMIMRPGRVLYPKMLFKAGEFNKMTLTMRQNIMAKMLSYIYMLWGMPEVVVTALYIACEIGLPIPNKDKLPYTWSKAKIPLSGYTPFEPLWNRMRARITEPVKMYNVNRMEYQYELIKFVKDHGYDISDSWEEKDGKIIWDYNRLFKSMTKHAKMKFRHKIEEHYVFKESTMQQKGGNKWKCNHIGDSDILTKMDAYEGNTINLMCLKCAREYGVSKENTKIVIGKTSWETNELLVKQYI